MPTRACAEVETSVSPEYIRNISAAYEEDWDFLKAIWPTFYPTIRLEWLDDLHAAPGYVDPPWIGWTHEAAGWTPPPLPGS